MIGRSWRNPAFEVDATGGCNDADKRFWTGRVELGVDVRGVEVRAGVTGSGGGTFPDIFA